MNHRFYDSDGQIAADMSQFNPVPEGTFCDAHTKRPKTKRPKTKRLRENVPGDITSQETKRPREKTSQGTKRPKGTTEAHYLTCVVNYLM